MVKHIVWDWNGTLLHDVDIVVRTMNETLVQVGFTPVTVEEYRAAYCRPIRTFYAKLVGRELSDEEWVWLDDAFHDIYHVRARECVLSPGAERALDEWCDLGGSQSLLSMYHHDQLVALVDKHGIAGYFSRVDGLRDAHGDHKAEFLVRHLQEQQLEPTEVLVVGDSVDDAHAAWHVGARCALYSGGFHDAASLAATDLPVVSSLGEAVALASR
ncbi:MAG: HAD hydrolase-like protein [Streptosporangiales bacterium]|nr:HAD hydrolase-like protein [Streptosporangiales bacterium]